MSPSRTFLSLSLVGLLLSGCATSFHFFGGGASESSSSSSSLLDTTQLSFEGVVQKVDVSVYMEGSHRLAMDDGSYLLLKSSVIGLDDYVGEFVRVTGLLSQSVEGNARVLQVLRAEVLLGQPETLSGAALPSSSSVSSFLESVSSAQASSVAASLPSVSSKAAVSSAARPASSSMQAIVRSSSSVAMSVGADAQAFSSRTAVMVKGGTDASRWTQQYCSSAAGFCVPVNKNWWFKSFGSSPTYLWHMEMSSSEIEAMGDGPISVSFFNGAVPGGATDMSIVPRGDTVVGYRSWTEHRHFEISAPSSLQAAVQFITERLSVYQPPAQ